MPFSLCPYRRFPLQCAVTYDADLFQGQGTIWNVSKARRSKEPSSSFGCQRRRVLQAHKISFRRKDIPVLAETFLNRYSQEYSKTVRGISEAALVLLINYSWPGNVRELESVIERAVTLSYAKEILPGDLPAAVQQVGSSRQILSNSVERARTLKQVEAEYIRLILDKTRGNKYQTAEILGIDRKTLYRKLAEMENEGVSE